MDQPVTGSKANSRGNSLEPSRITAEESVHLLKEGEAVLFLDARSKKSYRLSPVKIEGAVRIAPSEIAGRLHELPADRLVVVYCSEMGEVFSARVARLLLTRGFQRVRVLRGGLEAWLRAGFPAEQKE